MDRLLIIDDEKIIRNGLKVMIEDMMFDSLELTEAENGRQGLTIVETVQPDIILLDIKMPVMGGLEFARIIRSRGISAVILILSGYNEFEYAQEAIQYHVSGYLLKPVERDKLEASLRSAMEEVKVNRRPANQEPKHNEYLGNNISRLNERKLRELLFGADSTQKSLAQYIDNESVCISSRLVVVIACAIRYHNKGSITSFDWDAILRAKKPFSKNTIIIPIDDYSLIGICGIDTTKQIEEIRAALEVLTKKYLEMKIELTWGLSSIDSIDTPLQPKVKQAYNTLKEKNLYGEAKVYVSKEITERSKKPIIFSPNVGHIISLLKDGNKEPLRNYLSSIMTAWIHTYKIKVIDIEDLIITTCSKVHYQLTVDTVLKNKTFFSLREISTKIRQSTSYKDYIDHFVFTLLDIFKSVSSEIDQDSKKERKIILMAKAYINANFHRRISLEKIAEHLDMTSSYFSALFKRETGINLSRYIMQIRISKAITYLKDPRYKIYEIAYKVGFDDDKYFHKQFKQETGMTPGEFRENCSLSTQS